MSQNKNTGLGPSLLLKRTTPPEPAEEAHFEPPDAQTSEPPRRSDASAAISEAVIDEPPESGAFDELPEPASRRAPRPKKLRLKRLKRTIYLDADVDQQLRLAARVEEKERSEIVTEILRIHLPVYQISRTK